MKSICLVMSFFIVFSVNLLVVRAEAIDDTHAKDILLNLNIIGDTATVSRKYCITAIDKAIGATSETVRAQEMTFYYIAPFNDTYDPYVLMAWDTKIAFGNRKYNENEQQNVDYLSHSYELLFNGDDPATMKEICAFLVRCVGRPELDTDVTFEKAKELGLIKEEDAFYNLGNDPVDFDSLCVVLHRFLYQPRGRYFTGEFSPMSAVDSERSMTYLEFLQQQQKNNIIENVSTSM